MNYRKITTYLSAAALSLAFLVSGSAFAVDGPALQLDAQGGTWINNDPLNPQTTFCSTDVCDFYAIATPSGNLSQDTILGTTFYVSVALVPQTTTSADLGSIKINGVTYAVTGGMTYGAPPLSDIDGGTSDTGDLQPHGIFDTYYTEIAITFVDTMTMTPYNVQEAGGDPESQIGGTGSFYNKITIDTTNLDPSVELHLDLYNIAYVECKEAQVTNGSCDPNDLDTDLFAPFSHDAGTSSSTTSSGQSTTTSSGQSTTTSSGQSSTGTGVPEPSTLALLGFGLLSGLMFNRRRKAAA